MNPDQQFAFSLPIPSSPTGLPCPPRYLLLDLLLLPGGEGGAAVRRHFHLRHDSLDLAPHAVTLLCTEKLLQDKEAILVEL